MSRRIAALGVVALLLTGWLIYGQLRPHPLVVSGFIEADLIRVGSRVGGRVAEMHVEEGAAVKPGDVLFRIDPFDLKQRLAQADSDAAARRAEHAQLKSGYRAEEIEQARAARDRAAAMLKKAEAGPRPREVEVARETVNRAKADLELAESEHQRLVELQKEGQAAKMEMDRARRELKAAQAALAATEQQLGLLVEGTRAEEIAEARAALAEAEQRLKLREAGPRREEIERAAAQLAAAEAQAAAIKVQLEELTVVSPCACVVEAVDLHAGDFVARDAPSISLLDPSHLWIRAYVPENRLDAAALGRRVDVSVDSAPGRRFAGKITFVARDAEFTPRNVQTPEERSKQVFRIKVQIDPSDAALRVGMAADVHLEP